MKKLFGISVGLLIVISVIAYYPALKGFFASDDFHLINAVRIHGPFGIWTFHAGFFRPIISLSIFVDHSIWGLNPTGYKLTNVSTHILNSILVMLSTWLLTSRVVLERQISAIGSIFAGVIFALLPAHAEAVSWVSGRTDVICTFFALCSWCAFLLYDQKHKTAYLMASSVTFALALLSKEAVITLPVIMGLYIVYLYIIKKETRWLVRGLFANALIFLLYLPLRYIAVGGIGGYGTNVHLNFDPVRWTAYPPVFLARIIWPCCWPSDLLPSVWSLSEQVWFMRGFYLAIGVAFTAGIVVTAIMQIYKRQMTWGVALFLLVGSVIAQLPSVNLGIKTETRIGERVVYLPSVFISSLIAIVAVTLAPRKYLRLGIALIVAIYGTALWQANSWWYKSGEIARSIVASMRTIDSSSPVSVILPDHLRGAYIFRNGIQSASDLFGIHGEWKTIALVTLDSHSDRFVLELENGKYTLTPLNPKSAVIPLTPPAMEVTISADKKSAQIAQTDKLLVYYSEGQLQVAH